MHVLDDSSIEKEIEEAVNKAEELNYLIKQGESSKSQLMSNIRILGKNSDVILRKILTDDLLKYEKEIHKLKIQYVESLIVAGKLKNKMKDLEKVKNKGEKGEKRAKIDEDKSAGIRSYFSPFFSFINFLSAYEKNRNLHYFHFICAFFNFTFFSPFFLLFYQMYGSTSTH